MLTPRKFPGVLCSPHFTHVWYHIITTTHETTAATRYSEFNVHEKQRVEAAPQRTDGPHVGQKRPRYTNGGVRHSIVEDIQDIIPRKLFAGKKESKRCEEIPTSYSYCAHAACMRSLSYNIERQQQGGRRWALCIHKQYGRKHGKQLLVAK